MGLWDEASSLSIQSPTWPSALRAHWHWIKSKPSSVNPGLHCDVMQGSRVEEWEGIRSRAEYLLFFWNIFLWDFFVFVFGFRLFSSFQRINVSVCFNLFSVSGYCLEALQSPFLVCMFSSQTLLFSLFWTATSNSAKNHLGKAPTMAHP